MPWVVVREHLIVFLPRKRRWPAIAGTLHTSERRTRCFVLGLPFLLL